jgi:ABC-2 type transport system ATP-binding protein
MNHEGVDVKDLTIRFGRTTAIDQLSFSLTAGTSVALIGRNGAGKSTTLRVLAGVLPPNAGEVMLNGINIVNDPIAARFEVGYCPDVGGLIPRATLWEHLELSATIRGLDTSWQGRAQELIEAFDLTGAADRITAEFSHGMSRRSAVILAALHQPKVLLLDEPFDGVDPLGVDATMDVIAQAEASGSTVIVSTHLLPLAVAACSRALVLANGHITSDGPTSELAGLEGEQVYRRLLT